MDVIREYESEVIDDTLGLIASDGETIRTGSIVIDFHDISKSVAASGMIIPPQGIILNVTLKTTDIKGDISGIPVTVRIKGREVIKPTHPTEILFKMKKGDILYGIKSNEGGMTTYIEDDRPISKPTNKRKAKSRPNTGAGTRAFFDNSGYPSAQIHKRKTR